MNKKTKRHPYLQEKLEEWAIKRLRGKQAWVQYKDVDKTWERIGRPKPASLERFRNMYYEVKSQIKRDRMDLDAKIIMVPTKYVEANAFYPRFTLPEIETENDFNGYAMSEIEQCISSLWTHLTAKEEMSHLRRILSLVEYRIRVAELRMAHEKKNPNLRRRRKHG